MSRSNHFTIEPLEQRMLLTATLIGPAGTLSPDQNLVEFTQNNQPTLENLTNKATTPIPAVGTFSGDSKNIIYSTGNGGQAVPQLFIYSVASGASTPVPFNEFANGTGTKSISEIVASPNGRYASFVYTPAGGYIDAFHDVYLLDLQDLTTQQIGASDALHPAFSPDSQYVAYAGYTKSPVNPSGVFAYNISTGATIRLSVDNNGNPLPDMASDVTIGSGPAEPIGPIVWSADSKLVAFPLEEENSFAVSQTNYVRNLATNTTQDVTLSSFSTGSIERIGTGLATQFYFGVPGQFSPDDKYLIGPGFSILSTGATIAPTLAIVGFGASGQQVIVAQVVSGSSIVQENLYLVDLTTEAAHLLTPATTGGVSHGISSLVAVTPDGMHAIIQSNSPELTPDSPTDGSYDLYLVSLTLAPNDPPYNNLDFSPGPTSNIPFGGILSPDGHHVAFLNANTLHLADTSANTDIAIPGDGVLDQGVPFTASFTSDGKSLLFSTRVVIGGLKTIRIFRYDVTTGQTTSVPYEPQLSGDVGAIVFNSTGTFAAVTVVDRNGGYDLIVVNLITGEFTPSFAGTIFSFAGFNAAGNTVYFFSAGQASGLYSMDINTGATALLSKDSNGNPIPAGDFTVSGSPDGVIVGSQDSKFVAFTLDPSGGLQDTYVLNVQTGAVTKYDDPLGGGHRTAPIAFSPDDQYLLESGSTNEDSLVNLSIGQHTYIPFQEGEIGIGFADAGKSVLFEGSFFEGGGSPQVVSYDLASGKETTITTSPATAIGLTPDGSTLLVVSGSSPYDLGTPVPGDAGAYTIQFPYTPIPFSPTTIIDDDSATYTGYWVTTADGDGHLNSGFHEDGNVDKGSSTATFSLGVTAPGTYAVYALWPSIAFGKAATNVPFDILTSTGTKTVIEDQSQHTNQWIFLGLFNLSTNAALAVRNAGTNGYVIVDGVGTAPISVTDNPPPPPTAPTTVSEDDTATFTGAWWSSTSGSGVSGVDFHNDGNLAKGSSTATYPLHVATPGSYAVFARWPAISFGRVSTNVPFTVLTTHGNFTVAEDESQHTGQWVLLGTFDLGTNATLTIRNFGTTGIVLADAVGTAPSSDTTTNPPPPPPPTPIIIDDSDSSVVYTGHWWQTLSGSGAFGQGFENDGNQLKGSSSVTFPAPLPSAGSYEVFIRYPSISFGTAASNVPVDIITSSGTQTFTVDESKNTGEFFSLGTFTLDPSTAKVIIRNAGTNGIVLADAVEYLPAGSTTQNSGSPTTIVEDTAAAYTGDWWSSSSGSAISGASFHNDGNLAKGSSSATFRIPIAAAGSYQVFARWPSISFGSAATSVRFDIITSAGTTTVFEDETQNTGPWVLLGTFNLDPSSAAVVIRNADTTGIVLADAIGVSPA